jgi:hypothetical protein
MTINGQQTKAKEFAFDGCHKLYMEGLSESPAIFSRRDETQP